MNKYLKHLLETSNNNQELAERLANADYYMILGLNKSASSSEIYDSFKEIIEDIKPTFSLSENFEKDAVAYTFALKAYSTLYDPNKRKYYDKTIEQSENNQTYASFHDQDCPLVIIPTEEVDEKQPEDTKINAVSKREKIVAVLKSTKESIKRLKPTNKKEFLDLFMSLILTMIVSAGIYVETEKLKKEIESFDLKKALTNIEMIVEEINKTSELTINHEITDTDTKFGLAVRSGIWFTQFKDIEELEEENNISFVYTVKNTDLPFCTKGVVVEPEDDLNLGSMCEKYNTNIETLIHLNPKIFGSYESVEEHSGQLLKNPSMFSLTDNPGVINIPDIKSIKYCDVENNVVYQKVKEDL